MSRSRLAALCLVSSFLFAINALAGESPFGWIYTADVHPQGTFEYEHWSYLQESQAGGDYSFLQNREEIEYGVTPRLQVSGYLNWSSVDAKRNEPDGSTGGPGTDLGANDDPFGRYKRTGYDSVSAEVIYQVMNPLTDPIGLAVYVEPEIGPREREIELRLIAQKNFIDDRLIVAANLWTAFEHENMKMEEERATMLELDLGVSYRFANNWSAGIEARNHREYDGYWYGNKAHSAWFLGPNLHYASRHWWLTAAWRHQLPVVQAFTDEQRAVVLGDRIYGDEHSRNEFIVKIGVPFL